jgi:hypothetical protein
MLRNMLVLLQWCSSALCASVMRSSVCHRTWSGDDAADGRLDLMQDARTFDGPAALARTSVQQYRRVTRDLLVFLGRENMHRATRRRVADEAACAGSIPGFIDTDPGPRESGADRAPHVGVVLADAANEDDRLDAAEHRRHGG